MLFLDEKDVENCKKWFDLKPYDNYTEKELRDKYRLLAKKYHPDKNAVNEEYLKEINNAHDLLKGYLNYCNVENDFYEFYGKINIVNMSMEEILNYFFSRSEVGVGIRSYFKFKNRSISKLSEMLMWLIDLFGHEICGIAVNINSQDILAKVNQIRECVEPFIRYIDEQLSKLDSYIIKQGVNSVYIKTKLEKISRKDTFANCGMPFNILDCICKNYSNYVAVCSFTEAVFEEIEEVRYEAIKVIIDFSKEVQKLVNIMEITDTKSDGINRNNILSIYGYDQLNEYLQKIYEILPEKYINGQSVLDAPNFKKFINYELTENNKGLKDENGEIIVEAKYDEIYRFIYGYAIVRIRANRILYGAINEAGEEVIPVEVNELEVENLVRQVKELRAKYKKKPIVPIKTAKHSH